VGEEGTGNTDTDNVPQDLSCGLCMEPMWQPYQWGTGHVACWHCVDRWFIKGGKRNCPFTRRAVNPSAIGEDRRTRALWASVRQWAKESGAEPPTPQRWHAPLDDTEAVLCRLHVCPPPRGALPN